jgi:L-lactate dehydrogenase
MSLDINDEAPNVMAETTVHGALGDRARVGRVAIIGAGAVGSTTAYALLISGVTPEIVLINRNRTLAEGHVQDLKDAALFSHTTRIVAGDFSDCHSADVIIITVGVPQTPGMRSRLDDLKQSAAILQRIILEIARHDAQGVLLIASNPVDVLTCAAWKWSGLPPNRVIGSGTSLDTSRFRRRLGERYEVAPDNVHAYIIGEHGDSQVPVLSSAQIAGIRLEEFCRGQGLPYEVAALKAIANETRSAGLQIQQAKGASYFGIGAALTRITDAILRDEHAILTVSSLVPESMDLGEVCLSLPSVLTRDGIARVLPIPLNDAEKQAVRASAEILKRHLASLENSQGAAL